MPSQKRLAVTLGFLCLAVMALGAETVETFPLDIEKAPGFKKVGDTLVPMKTAAAIPGKGQATLIEAENADESVEVKVSKDGASGETFVRSFKMLKYYYVAREKGQVAIWGFIRQTDKDNSIFMTGHQWNSTRSYTQKGLKPEEELKKNAGKWRWEHLSSISTEPGVGSFCLVYSWPGIPEIDKLMLIDRQDTPEKLEAAAKTERVATGEPSLESRPFEHSAALKLVDAKLLGAGVEDAVIEMRPDAATEWRPAKDVPLTSGLFRLRARFPKDMPADLAVRRFEAGVAMNGDGYLKLDNGKVRFDFDVKNNGLFRISSPALKTTFAAPGKAVPFFDLRGIGDKTPGSTLEEAKEHFGALKKRGEDWPAQDIILGPKNARLARFERKDFDGKPGVEFEYVFESYKITAVVAVALERDFASKWTLTLKNGSEYDILNYQFPNIAGLKIGDSGYDDKWANTSIYGPWMAGFEPEDRPYPGWGALGWVDLFDSKAGIAFMTRDCMEGETSFKLRSERLRDSEACSLITAKRHCVAAGETRTWTYSVLLHPGDWHAAADDYRLWFQAEFGMADHFPDWIRDSNGWLSINPALSDKNYKWPMILAAYEDARRLGLNWIQGWGQFGSNPCGSFWWPSPKYGPIEEFAALNKKIRDMGGHVGYYLMFDRENRYNIIDRKTYDGYLPQDQYPEGVPIMSEELFVKSHFVGDSDGKIRAWPRDEKQWKDFRDNLDKLHAENKTTTWAVNTDNTFPGKSMATMNPCDKDWQDWLVMWVDKLYVGKWHCDTSYQDVLACGTKGRSFDLRRGDNGHVYGSGNFEIAKRLTEEGKKIDPAFVLSAEGKLELVTRWAVGMTSSEHYGWIHLDTHRYTHPDHILVLGGNNGGFKQMLFNCGLAFIYGAKNDVILAGDVNGIRELVTFRQPFIKYQSRSVYKDTVGVSFSGDGVEARRFERFDGARKTILVCAVNRKHVDDGAVEVDVSAFDGKSFGIFWIASNGVATKPDFERKGDIVETLVPNAEASALFLVTEPALGEELIAQIRPELMPRGIRAKYWAVNLSPKARDVKIAINGPGGKKVDKDVAIGPYAVVSDIEEWAAPGASDNGGDVSMLLDGRQAAMGYVHALAENRSFEDTGTSDENAPDGRKVLRFGPAEGWQGHGMRLNLRPSCKYKLSVMGRRSGENGRMFALVRLRSSSRGWQYHRMDFPKDKFNEWINLGTEFVTPKDLAGSDVHLYNMNSKETVDYDGLKIEIIDEKSCGLGIRELHGASRVKTPLPRWNSRGERPVCCLKKREK